MGRKSNKVVLVCQHCKKEYKIAPSKAKNSKYCSKKCMDDARDVKATYKCKVCGKEFKSGRPKTYCSRACYEKDVKKERVKLNCQSCGKEYEKPKGQETKYCSRDCTFVAQSSGLADIPSNGRKGFRKDLNPKYFFKSSLEADYARYCDSIGKKYIYEHKTFKVSYGNKDKVYTPDFYHPDEDRYVETKAVRRDRKFNSNLLAADILKEQGVNIDVLLMDDFYRSIKQSGHYWLIDNIENKNYDGTRHLIYLKKKAI
tara:strand:+ start:1403 stop:2173 length:771 start_codon:yes stop_codon:yes gene_type:complete